ncbi:hypothetical protein CEXT_589331 [Caerostris extrusa]|uniref:Uncharacterized protein n=1 Tax=Caerostris extrusa TaxID=172846 RepID=A0AAV4XCU5_CAEEX|nr:hypothetical protein CEXT_589331 [Caerostris extrusa]
MRLPYRLRHQPLRLLTKPHFEQEFSKPANKLPGSLFDKRLSSDNRAIWLGQLVPSPKPSELRNLFHTAEHSVGQPQKGKQGRVHGMKKGQISRPICPHLSPIRILTAKSSVWE